MPSMKTTLLIMAAGIGSRFGGGNKQLAPVDEAGHIIMDYSIHDAIEAGFNKIVFIIRRDIEADFKEVMGNRIEAVCAAHGVEVGYAFQAREDIPAGYPVPEGRTKPWGTGQAVLAARNLIREPFAVLNADDYYGKEAFVKIYDFLVSSPGVNQLCMAGFQLKNVLSDFGGVTRGICQVNADGYLTDVVETSNIVKTETGAAVEGNEVDINALVSMNMWGLPPGFLKTLEEGFVSFFETSVPTNPLKAEYLLPIFIGQLLREQRIRVKVLETGDQWFGVTYQEDKPLVVQKFQELIQVGTYLRDLYSDL